MPLPPLGSLLIPSWKRNFGGGHTANGNKPLLYDKIQGFLPMLANPTSTRNIDLFTSLFYADVLVHIYLLLHWYANICIL